MSGSINANFGGTATISEGITFDNKFTINGILKGKAEVGRFGLVPMLGVNADVLKQIPFVYGFVKNTSIAIWLKAGMQGSADIQFRPEWDIQKSTWAISLGVEAVYQPKLPQGEFKVLVGGDGTLSYEPPNDASGQSVKSVKMRAYVSLEAKLFTYAPTWEFILIDHTYFPFGKSFRLDRQGVWHELQSGELRPASREYLKLGSERFVFSSDELKDSPDLRQILNNFAPRKRSHLQALAGVDPLPLQADLTLVQNVYPQTQPAMAADRTSGRIMLLYTADPGTAPSLQRTDVRWILWDGTAWTEPRSIRDDARGEFSPVVAWDGNGDAIAVWQRIRDAAFADNDLTAMAAQMEIVWSRWDHLTGKWSEPGALTDNAVLDTRPMLCGPMADGDLLLTWTRNGKNRMPGSDGPGEGDLVLATR